MDAIQRSVYAFGLAVAVFLAAILGWNAYTATSGLSAGEAGEAGEFERGELCYAVDAGRAP